MFELKNNKFCFDFFDIDKIDPFDICNIINHNIADNYYKTIFCAEYDKKTKQ